MATFGKSWKDSNNTYRYRYSGKFAQWKKKQIKLPDSRGRWRFVDLDKAWRPTRRGEFRRKWQ